MDKTNLNKASLSSDKKTYELVFGGLPFKLKTSHDEKTVLELAQFVDRRLQEALAATKSGSFQSAAVLAALNIAEELILLKRKALTELERIEERAMKLSEDLEKSKISEKETKAEVSI
jgi:cell division protein ZapA